MRKSLITIALLFTTTASALAGKPWPLVKHVDSDLWVSMAICNSEENRAKRDGILGCMYDMGYARRDNCESDETTVCYRKRYEK
jgi:hypothetical protein